jgi:hypothetical protein
LARAGYERLWKSFGQGWLREASEKLWPGLATGGFGKALARAGYGRLRKSFGQGWLREASERLWPGLATGGFGKALARAGYGRLRKCFGQGWLREDSDKLAVGSMDIPARPFCEVSGGLLVPQLQYDAIDETFLTPA